MIAAVRDEESTWFTGFDRNFFISRGANYAAMSKVFCFILMIQYVLRKRKKYIGNISMAGAMAAMLEGRKEYLKICREKS